MVDIGQNESKKDLAANIDGDDQPEQLQTKGQNNESDAEEIQEDEEELDQPQNINAAKQSSSSALLKSPAINPNPEEPQTLQKYQKLDEDDTNDFFQHEMEAEAMKA